MRHRDARALEGLGRLAAIVAGRPVDELEYVLRDAQVLQHGANHALDRRERTDPVQDRRGDEAEHARVDAHRHLRRVCGPGKNVEHLANAVRIGIGKVEALAVQALLVREEIQRVGDEVDRHDIDAPALDADRRHPGRQHLAHPLNQLEEVVRTVDLVDVTGARMPDDEPGPVDPPRPLAFLAYDAFGIVLGPEVWVIELLGFLEHVLAKRAFIETGGGDRAHIVEAACLHGLRELDHVPRAFDVGPLLVFGARREIVDRGEVKDVLDLPVDLFQIALGDAEQRLGEIADDRDHLFLACAPLLAQCGELLLRTLADEDVDGFAALQQIGDQEPTDKTGAAGDEVSHRDFSSIFLRRPPASISRSRPGPGVGAAMCKAGVHYTAPGSRLEAGGGLPV